MGFIQHVTIDLQATYSPGEVLTAKYDGKPLSDYVALLDHVPGPLPWYDTATATDIKEGAIFSNATPKNNSAVIGSNDSPAGSVPLTYAQDPDGVLDQNNWPKPDLITKVTFMDTFSLDVAARTTDEENDASDLYYAEASGDWSFDGGGTFQWDWNAASPKKSKMDFTGDRVPAVSNPVSWVAVMAMRQEVINYPVPADFNSAKTFS